MNLNVLSCGYSGIDTYLVDVEFDISSGIPGFFIIGLGDTVVLESRERVRSAIKTFNLKISQKKIMVNLSPAYIKKEGSHFDLPMALGILKGLGELKIADEILKKYIFMGELSLDGRVKSVKGCIGAALLAKEKNLSGIVVPMENIAEVLLIPDIKVIGITNIVELKKLTEDIDSFYDFNKIKQKEEINKRENMCINFSGRVNKEKIDFSDVKGQKLAKRAIEIAVAGGHNLLMVGSPGSGKSMLAKRIRTIMPEMEKDEIIECTKIYSILGELTKENPLIIERPFRSPHHTGTIASIIGGGRVIKPGEITLAHNGILFLDELSEFSKEVLESLRQPLEEGKIYVSRLGYKLELPSKFLMIGASNPCNCGLLFENKGDRCKCSPRDLKKYSKKLSGPILDRIDLFVEIRKLDDHELLTNSTEESSLKIKNRVLKVRKIQKDRLKDKKSFLNGDMNSKEVEEYCKLVNIDPEFTKKIINSFSLSARGFYKILKIARTIADLENSTNIEKKHILESLSFRNKMIK